MLSLTGNDRVQNTVDLYTVDQLLHTIIVLYLKWVIGKILDGAQRNHSDFLSLDTVVLLSFSFRFVRHGAPPFFSFRQS